MLDSIRVIRKHLFSPCRGLSLENVVKLGDYDGRSGKRSVPVGARTYFSKQEEEDGLLALTVQSSEFLVFRYREEKRSEEVWVSHPHMYRITRALERMQEILRREDVFIENDEGLWLSQEAADTYVHEGDLSNGKAIAMLPEVVQGEGDSLIQGVSIMVGNKDCMVIMDHDQFDSLVFAVQRFNLAVCSSALILTAAVWELSGEGPPSRETVKVDKIPRR